ncbi:MAG: class I SAM-dependent methyltransferase [Gemmatimonadaceae bacterium]
MAHAAPRGSRASAASCHSRAFGISPRSPMNLPDYFSARAVHYAAHRPDYPPELFDFVAGLVARHDLVWDCGTGSGQAAVALAERFARVVGTDASAAQIERARAHPRVEYRVATAESSGLPDHSVDVVTVAQALHWFDLDRFYAEARRVAAPGGALAVWSYGDPVLDDPALDAVLARFNFGTLAAYWPSERRAVGEGYLEFPFPFAEVKAPRLAMERSWTLAELAGYMRSWSGVARYVSLTGQDPVPAVEAALAGAGWSEPERRHLVRWPLFVRAGHARPR